jgi:hypothetical protein
MVAWAPLLLRYARPPRRWLPLRASISPFASIIIHFISYKSFFPELDLQNSLSPNVVTSHCPQTWSLLSFKTRHCVWSIQKDRSFSEFFDRRDLANPNFNIPKKLMGPIASGMVLVATWIQDDGQLESFLLWHFSLYLTDPRGVVSGRSPFLLLKYKFGNTHNILTNGNHVSVS